VSRVVGFACWFYPVRSVFHTAATDSIDEEPAGATVAEIDCGQTIPVLRPNLQQELRQTEVRQRLEQIRVRELRGEMQTLPVPSLRRLRVQIHRGNTHSRQMDSKRCLALS